MWSAVGRRIRPSPVLQTPANRAEQRDLRRVILAGDQHAHPVRDFEVELVDQHAAVAGRAQREALARDAAVVLFDALDRRVRHRPVHPLGETAEAREHRGVRRDRLELGHDQRERPIRCENAIAACVITPNSTWRA